MKPVRIVAVSCRTPMWAQTAEKNYRKQLSCFNLSVMTVKPSTSAVKETHAIRACLPKSAHGIVLDSGGLSLTSNQFATTLSTWLVAPHPPVFIIGGANGIPEPLRQTAHDCLSLSPLTFPHTLARLILVEQLFRADCLMRQHPYPR